ncbi:hypothetical protein QYF61_022536 [Mycteria americana]|uniref:Uncharacterized protein n=1 Tax=Mycteria americana TaxID=33587 RepID=A0AAN7Q7P9_MYCAM|nr:hypothetical protein QYF61_022536 [Mycteria americana]
MEEIDKMSDNSQDQMSFTKKLKDKIAQLGEERKNIPTNTMAKPDTISVSPITKKKQWKWKSAHLVRDEEASPKKEQEKESEEADCSAAEQSQEQEEEETEMINETETT